MCMSCCHDDVYQVFCVCVISIHCLIEKSELIVTFVVALLEKTLHCKDVQGILSKKLSPR